MKTDDVKGLRREAKRLGALRAAPLDGVSVRAISVPGYAVIEAGTVEAAAELAAELAATGRYASVEVDHQASRALRAPSETTLTNGTLWHLRNTTTPIADVNADGAWDMGYTGTGVNIGIVEGGFWQAHTDLLGNYSSAGLQTVGSEWHATGCAGIAAGVGNNSGGACGLAYEAQISEQDYGLTATDEAAAFAYRNDIVAIKSNSWGPTDNGTITDIASVSKSAIIDAVENGRGGLGTIFCWAAGNGGPADRVDYDPYASDAVHVRDRGDRGSDYEASYNEYGSSMRRRTRRGTWRKHALTTAEGGGYQSFGGTSGASPLGRRRFARRCRRTRR
ncbi:MAG: S8 family serine peptidase [Phycisphaerales bacterium]